MSELHVRQHIVIGDDYHRAVSILAAESGISNGDIVEELLEKIPSFKRKLEKVRRK